MNWHRLFKNVLARFTGRITLVDGVQVAVSSTLVRRRLADGSSVRYLVPPPVIAYARANRLYGLLP